MQSKAKTFDIMHISGRNAVKLLEQMLLVRWRNSYPPVEDADRKHIALLGGDDVDRLVNR